jgi:hypothetical protein
MPATLLGALTVIAPASRARHEQHVPAPQEDGRGADVPRFSADQKDCLATETAKRNIASKCVLVCPA